MSRRDRCTYNNPIISSLCEGLSVKYLSVTPDYFYVTFFRERERVPKNTFERRGQGDNTVVIFTGTIWLRKG